MGSRLGQPRVNLPYYSLDCLAKAEVEVLFVVGRIFLLAKTIQFEVRSHEVLMYCRVLLGRRYEDLLGRCCGLVGTHCLVEVFQLLVLLVLRLRINIHLLRIWLNFYVRILLHMLVAGLLIVGLILRHPRRLLLLCHQLLPLASVQIVVLNEVNIHVLLLSLRLASDRLLVREFICASNSSFVGLNISLSKSSIITLLRLVLYL